MLLQGWGRGLQALRRLEEAEIAWSWIVKTIIKRGPGDCRGRVLAAGSENELRDRVGGETAIDMGDEFPDGEWLDDEIARTDLKPDNSANHKATLCQKQRSGTLAYPNEPSQNHQRGAWRRPAWCSQRRR
jgi:hypothetical protein